MFVPATILPADDEATDASRGEAPWQHISVPVVPPPYPTHVITAGFSQLTGYPLARSMTNLEGGSNGHIAQPILVTSPRSWAEADLSSLVGGKVAFDADKGDKQGPITLGAAVSAPATAVPPPPAGNGSPRGA